jgi:hypothetical protein
VVPSFEFVTQVPAGGTGHLTMNVTAQSDDLDTGIFNIPFQVFSATTGAAAFGSVDFSFVTSGCRVSRARELMITTTSVVDDPIRTTSNGPAGDPRSGAWTFKRLVENMAPTAADAPAMVEQMLGTFGQTTTINGFQVAPRNGMRSLILDAWPRTASGELDLAQAPVTLLAIVNRFDLRNLAAGDAGEGRFVFGFTTRGRPLQATIIFEYKLPATTEADVLAWANDWHALGALPFPSEDYNAALQALTERFAGRGVRPSHPNGNAINAVRTNEIDLGNNGLWELREFVLSPDTGRLVPATIKLTPALSFNNSATLASYINANQAAIIAETHTVPDEFQGAPFQAGAVFNDSFTQWNAPGVNLEARHHFGLNTCNGCHSIETNTRFLMVFPRTPGFEASLSPFLTGTTAFDRISGTPRTFNDLGRRAADLRPIVCPNDPPPSTGMGGQGGTTGSTGMGGAGGTTGSTGMGGVGGRTGMGGTVGTGGRGPIPMTGTAGTTGSSQPIRLETAAAPQTTLSRGIARVH